MIFLNVPEHYSVVQLLCKKQQVDKYRFYACGVSHMCTYVMLCMSKKKITFFLLKNILSHMRTRQNTQTD